MFFHWWPCSSVSHEEPLWTPDYLHARAGRGRPSRHLPPRCVFGRRRNCTPLTPNLRQYIYSRLLGQLKHSPWRERELRMMALIWATHGSRNKRPLVSLRNVTSAPGSRTNRRGAREQDGRRAISSKTINAQQPSSIRVNSERREMEIKWDGERNEG